MGVTYSTGNQRCHNKRLMRELRSVASLLWRKHATKKEATTLRHHRRALCKKMNIKSLAEKYEKNVGCIVHTAAQPTEESVQRIEEELGAKLPSSLVEFAKESKNYGNWLASIGPDYTATNHILNINRMLREEGVLPTNFIVINVGYDEDYSCIDVDTYDVDEDEYLITYWAPDVSLRESDLSENFLSYLKSNIDYWSKNA